MMCSADAYHRPDNPYRCVLNTDEEILFARGNYGINAGCGFVYMPEPGGPNKPVVDGLQSLAEGSRTIQWGNGIAGINKSFSKKDIVNGLATTVAVDELRAGLAPVDSRGTWRWDNMAAALHMATASIAMQTVPTAVVLVRMTSLDVRRL